MKAEPTELSADSAKLLLELYIVGDSPRSAAALANLEALKKKYFPDAAIEVIDVWENPRRILTNSVFVTPMLVKVAPAPLSRIIGDLSDEAKVLQALGFSPEASKT